MCTNLPYFWAFLIVSELQLTQQSGFQRQNFSGIEKGIDWVLPVSCDFLSVLKLFVIPESKLSLKRAEVIKNDTE